MTIKTTAAMALASVTLCVSGANPLDFATCTEAEVRAVAEEALMAPTPAERYRKITQAGLISRMRARPDLNALRLELDSRFAEKGVEENLFLAAMPVSWPKLSKASLEKLDKERPRLAALIRKYAALGREYCPNPNYSAEDLVICFNERIAYRHMNVKSCETLLRYFSKCGAKIVRKYLYDHGKSFVTKDGVNPCEAYLSELSGAINAPRLAGLNEWLSKMGCSYGFDLSFLPSEEEIAQLKMDIITGEKDIDEWNKVLLYFGLGVEGYNAFVKKYNGEN